MNEILTSVCFGLGSNLGDREYNLKVALDHLSRVVRLRQCSAIYETEPIGYKDQPCFLNIVCYGDTGLGPQEILRSIKWIEGTMGRVPNFPNGPRLLDVDILLYGDEVINTPDLIIPHPRLWERAFVLVPLAEIAPVWVHPVLKRTISGLVNDLIYGSEVKRWGPPPGVFKT